MPERFDVVIVGARCAGSAAAAVLARAGRRVLVLDRARFPSDTLSTHVLVPGAVIEMARIGALERLLALDVPRCPWVTVQAGDALVREHWGAREGVDYGLCIPRPEQDAELVATARAAGAEVREGCSVDDVVWSCGRVAGVRCDSDEIRASLVIGADGRRSTIAARVGSWRPYRASRNGRGAAFRYMDDPQAGTEWGTTMSQWRAGETVGFSFPTLGGQMLVLLMGPVEDVARFRASPDETWSARIASFRGGLAERVAGATGLSKIRSTTDTAAFFRASSGPGWALAGDAGHFKDPILGQGQRDAVRGGRTLAEAVVPVLDDPPALDVALRRWEHARDRDCLPTYHWGNRESHAGAPSRLFVEVVRTFEGSGAPDLGDTFARFRAPERVVGPRHLVRGLARALAASGRRDTLAEALQEVRAELDIRRDRFAPFRSARTSVSERDGWSLGAEPRVRGGLRLVKEEAA